MKSLSINHSFIETHEVCLNCKEKMRNDLNQMVMNYTQQFECYSQKYAIYDKKTNSKS